MGDFEIYSYLKILCEFSNSWAFSYQKDYKLLAVSIRKEALTKNLHQIMKKIQARIAQLVAYRLGTVEVPGSNPSKGENFSVKISNWIVRI